MFLNVSRKVDHSNMNLINLDGKHVASYQPYTINQMYHFKEPHMKITHKWLQSKAKTDDYLAQMKGWWAEGNLRSKPLPIRWPTTKFQKSIQVMVILLARILGRKYASRFPNKWVPIIHQIISNGSTLNWGEIISSNLDGQLKKVQKDHEFYMASYLKDVMCVSWEYLEMGWKCDPSQSSIHVYWKILW